MWYTPWTDVLSAKRSPHDSPWSERNAIAVSLAETEALELLEERGEEDLGLALDGLPVCLARRLERRTRESAWMPSITSRFAARQSVRSEWRTV